MRLNPKYAGYDPQTFAGKVKMVCYEKGITLTSLAPVAGLKPDSIRARLCISRGKRSMQPAQVTAIADHLGIDRQLLHRLAARHEGWDV